METRQIHTLPKVPHHDPFHLTAGILHLRWSHLLPNSPSITLDEINDKSKGDEIFRIVAIIQIMWIVQVIARGLSISQLEITIVVFSVCAFIIYTLDWKKPKGVNTPYTLLFLMIAGASRGFYEDDPWYHLLRSVFGSLIFSGIHCATWNFTSPYTIEHLLWRSTSLYCVIFIFLFLFIFLVFGTIDWARRWCLRVTGLWYIFARLFSLVDLFRVLCFLAPDAHTST